MNARVAQELLKVLQRVGLEIGRILVQRHGQYGLDLDIKIQGRLDHQEVCPWRHEDRKSTRLNSSHGYISYAVFCLKKKKKNNNHMITRYVHVYTDGQE